MLAQRIAAVFLAVLMLAIVLLGCAAIGHAIGSNVGGWVVGALTCVLILLAWLRQGARADR